jgi:hypothetical protein
MSAETGPHTQDLAGEAFAQELLENFFNFFRRFTCDCHLQDVRKVSPCIRTSYIFLPHDFLNLVRYLPYTTGPLDPNLTRSCPKDLDHIISKAMYELLRMLSHQTSHVKD